MTAGKSRRSIAEGALVLIGVLKSDEMQVKYRLRFGQNGKIWKLPGINIDARKL